MRRSRPKPARGSRSTAVLALGIALTCLGAPACSDSHGAQAHGVVYGPYVAPSEVAAIEVPPPPFSEGAFPCSDCHDPEIPVNTQRRELSMAHDEIVLEHAAGQRWCLDCHSASDRDSLHLANGDLVPFEESYRLCGQCHGDKLRDWRAGVHGRRTGHWDDGEKEYLLCVHCHNSHSPRFAPLEPEPAPHAPRRTP